MIESIMKFTRELRDVFEDTVCSRDIAKLAALMYHAKEGGYDLTKKDTSGDITLEVIQTANKMIKG